jgi:hypothetical protein
MKDDTATQQDEIKQQNGQWESVQHLAIMGISNLMRPITLDLLVKI